MFFILSKVLSFLITPIVWVTIALLLSVLAKNKKLKAVSMVTGLVLFLFFTNSFILNEVMRKWEVKGIKEADINNYDVGIVLGGMSSYDPVSKHIHFFQSIDRLLQALDLYSKGRIKKILITGGSGSMVYLDKEGIYLKPYLERLHIPASDILVESESKNTRENAVFSAEILKKAYPSGGKYILITSGYHMPRSIRCFAKAGVKAEPYSTDAYSGKRIFYLDYLLLPNTQALQGWDVLAHELFGFVSYKVAGYI